MAAAELEERSFSSAAAWRAWLAANHDRSPGIWVLIAKKSAHVASVTHDEAVDEALCFGWIDGQRTRGDDRYFRQRFTPWTRRSPWSKINTERVERPVRAKKMRAAGMREVEAAKADGRWNAALALEYHGRDAVACRRGDSSIGATPFVSRARSRSRHERSAS